jgi:hypothetical protein
MAVSTNSHLVALPAMMVSVAGHQTQADVSWHDPSPSAVCGTRATLIDQCS